MPPVTAQTEAGKKVALKEEWLKKGVRYINTENGEEIKEETEVASVYAVSDGQGNAVPVPYGFWYVGGNFSNGVIISDNEDDKYDGKTDKTAYSYTTNLKGNQFVWIPCTISEYKKTNWNKEYGGWDDTTSGAELAQIEKYGGFYVGRYEAGLAIDMKEDTSTYNVYNTPQSKANLIPWDYIDWTHAKANAESMKNNDYVSSRLITGTQWDVILNTMKNKTEISEDDIMDSGTWGNHCNNIIEYTGRKATGHNNNGQSSTLSKFEPVDGTSTKGSTKNNPNNDGELLTTGASSVTEKYHIFDIAGNLWEWTEEDSHYATSGQRRVFRGGCFWNNSRDYCVAYRYGERAVSESDASIGFRVVLYIN